MTSLTIEAGVAQHQKPVTAMRERTQCPLCGEPLMRATQLLHVVSEWVKPEQQLVYMCCGACGLVYDRFEQTSFVSIIDSRVYTLQDFIERGTVKRRFHHYHRDVLLRECGAGNGRRLLDVGTSDGSFLKVMQEEGFDVVGVDPESKFADLCRQHFHIPIIPAFLEDAEIDPSSCDVVTVFGVFEHVYRPRKFLSGIYDVLKPGGLLYMAIPSATSAHSSSIAKGHTCLYSRSTLRQALESCGFRVRRTHEPGMGNVFYDRLEMIAEKVERPAAYRFRREDDPLRMKRTLQWSIIRGHFEWVILIGPRWLRARMPWLYRVGRAVYRAVRRRPSDAPTPAPPSARTAAGTGE